MMIKNKKWSRPIRMGFLTLATIFTAGNLLLFASDTINEDNHPPYSLSKYTTIGTFVGNSFSKTYDGRDPDSEDDVYFVLNDKAGLESIGVFCDFYNANQLMCRVDNDVVVPQDSTCQLKDDYILPSCETVQITYHIVDSRGMSSKENYATTLYIASKDENNSNVFETDITKNPRAFSNEMQEKTRLSDEGNLAYSDNIGVGMMNSDLFSNPDSAFGKQLNVGIDVIQNKDVTGMNTDSLMDSTSGADALGNTTIVANNDFVNNTYQESSDALGYDTISAPIFCTISRTGTQLEKYFVCSEDPMLNINQDMATKYYTTGQSESAALATCESACQESAVCNLEQQSNNVDFVRNKNFLDQTSYIIAQNDVQTNMDTISNIKIFEKTPLGLLTDSYDITLSTPIDTSDFYWDDSIIPSSRQVNTQVQLNVSFFGDSFFSEATTGNTYILSPKISYWAKIDNHDTLKSYDASKLYTIIFSNIKDQYRCPIPSKSSQTYDTMQACSDLCSQQYECTLFTNTSYSDSGISEIRNYCKDALVAGQSLESLVNSGECRLKNESVVDENNYVTHQYVRNFVQIDPYRPDIGFSESPDILKKEKATEIAYAFDNMVNSGSDRGQIDETEKMNSNLFKDFDFHQSDEMFKVLPIIEGDSLANMDIYLSLKLNPSFFDKVKLKRVDRDTLTSDREKMIYDAYVEVLQRVPDEDGIAYWTSIIPDTLSYEEIKQAIYSGAINNPENSNIVGITIGILTVDVPTSVDENTTIHTEFKVMDSEGNFRTAFVTGSYDDYMSKKTYSETEESLVMSDAWEGDGQCFSINPATDCLLGITQRGVAAEDYTGCPTGSRKLKCWYISNITTETYESELLQTVLDEYLKKIGRMPSHDDLYYWADKLKNGMSMEEFHSSFDEAVQSNTIAMAEVGFMDTNTTDTFIELNSMLSNYIYARGGSFNPSTLSFETGSITSSTPSDYIIVNPYVYNEKLENNYMQLKGYYLNEATVGKPILTTKNSTTSEHSAFNHTYHFLFAYVDKVPNMKDLKVKDFIDKVWEDYKNNIKKYFVWDYKTLSMATKKISDTLTAWKNHPEINRYAQYFKTNSFSYLNSSDLVSTFYEDASKNVNDNIYIAKRGDDYIIKINSTGENFIMGEQACADGNTYDMQTGKCVHSESIVVEHGSACSLEDGFTYDASSKKCIKHGTKSVSFSGSNMCTDDGGYLNVTSTTGTPSVRFYNVPSGLNCGGNTGTVMQNIELPTGATVASQSYQYKSSGWGCYTKSGTVHEKESMVYCPASGGQGVNVTGTLTYEYDIAQDPLCPDRIINFDTGECYSNEDTTISTDPQCPDDSWLVDPDGNCYKYESNAVDAYDKNGYYFAYLQKDNDNNIKFLTPLANSSPVQCEQHPYKCTFTQQIFYSQESCYKYCVSSSERHIAATWGENGKCFDMGPDFTGDGLCIGPLQDGVAEYDTSECPLGEAKVKCWEIATSNCEEQASPSQLLVSQFYNIDSCVNSCLKYEQKVLPKINMKLVAKNDLLTQSGSVQILKQSSTYGDHDFSNELIRNVANEIFLGSANDGIELGYFGNNDNLQIKYSTEEDLIAVGNLVDGQCYIFDPETNCLLGETQRGVADENYTGCPPGSRKVKCWFVDPNSENKTIGLARANDDYLNSVATGYISTPELGRCINSHAFYPNMGLFLELDYDLDGHYDDEIQIAENFLCHPDVPKTVTQNISFNGDSIQYDYVSQDGTVTHLTKNIVIANRGECQTDSDVVQQIPLSQTYVGSEYIPSANILEVGDINSTMRFARKPTLYGMGEITRNMNSYIQFFAHDENISALYDEINTNYNIPIPFYKGVHATDDFDILMEDTGIDSAIDSTIGDYKLKVGFGFVPWNDCRNFDGLTTTVSYDYIQKTDCSNYGSEYIYLSYENKCVSAKFIDSVGNYYCPYGTETDSGCEASPDCSNGWFEDPTDTSRCFKSVISSTSETEKICKPWWTITREYDCSGAEVSNMYDLLSNITAGPPRYTNVCTQRTRIYRSLSLDSDGNIIEGEGN